MIEDKLKIGGRTLEERSRILKRKMGTNKLPQLISLSINRGYIKSFLTPAMIVLIVRPSVRELEILDLLQQGFTFNAIGFQLTISIETVKSHKKNIFIKLNAKTITHAVAIGKHMGFI